jgi:2-methylcitrate dehydratase PrpD
VLNVAGGMSGFAGALVPELILAGFEPGQHAIQEAFTALVGRGFAPQQLVEELGQTWEITRNHFRLRACCSPIYPALDALEATLAELRPTPEQVERIDVATYAFAAVMSEPDPPTAFGAHYSLPHAAAAIVAWGRADEGCFTEAVLDDPTIRALRQRVRVCEDPELTARLPWQKAARVTVSLTDGRTSTRRCDNSRGGFDHPYARSELIDKFRDLAGRVLTPAGVAEVQALIDGLDDVADMSELMDALRRGARASTAATMDTADAASPNANGAD